MPQGGSSGSRRARASARRRPKVRWASTFSLFAVGALMASMSGALAFFLPAVITAKTLRDLGLKPETAMGRIFGGSERIQRHLDSLVANGVKAKLEAGIQALG